MSGTTIIAELLLADAEFLELVPAAGIKEDLLPDGAPLNLLLLRSVSLVDRQPLKQGPLVHSVERVAVTVRAKSLRDRKAVIARVRTVCARRAGDLSGCFRVSILTAGLGPSVIGPAGSFERTQDFRVSFDAPA
jgi:hypothetical protein